MISAGNFCRTLVKTSEPFQVRSVSFATPLNWKHHDDLRHATLVAQQRQNVPDLETFVGRLGECEAVQSHVISFRALYIFFIIVFALCGAMLMNIVINR